MNINEFHKEGDVMEKDKKYYWLRLKKDFFKRHDIQIIESMPNGKDYLLFYLKLLVESVDHDGKLRFSDTIPYNEQMLATITNTNIDVVRSAMQCFVNLNMIEVLEDKTIYMTEVEKMLGTETYWAEQKRKQRLQSIPQLPVGQCPIEVRAMSEMSKQEIDIDKEIDIDIDKEIDISIEKINWKEILNCWNEAPLPIKPIRAITEKRKDKVRARVNSLKLTNEDIIQAINNIKTSRFVQGKNNKNWIIDFDWLFKDDTSFSKVLEGKYNRGDKSGSTGQDYGTGEGKYAGFKAQTKQYETVECDELI
jgi:predicted phage replisome organizer